MEIEFVELSDEARTNRYLRPEAPAAFFLVEGGSSAPVLARDVTAFSDLRFQVWPAPVRCRLLEALCAPVRRCDWASAGRQSLDLAGRFGFGPQRDAPDWHLTGFTHLGTVDLKLVKHVLGRGERDPEQAVAWWSRTLGLKIDAESLLERLTNLGCTAWRRLDADPDAGAWEIQLYRGLPRTALIGCIKLLSQLRECYMAAVASAVRSVGEIAAARHAHLGTARREEMHLLDDRGLLVVAKGRRKRLSVATAFGCLAGGEAELGPATLRRRWLKVVQRIRGGGSGTFHIHSPAAWRRTP